MKYEALQPIKHDGKRFAAGDVLDLSESAAQLLVDAGAVAPAKAKAAAEKAAAEKAADHGR